MPTKIQRNCDKRKGSAIFRLYFHIFLLSVAVKRCSLTRFWMENLEVKKKVCIFASKFAA